MDIYRHSNLTRAQLVFWLGQKLNPETPLYNNGLGLIIPMAVDPGHFQRAYDKLVQQCDALRTVFEVVDGVPMQRVLEEASCTPEYLDFSGEADPLAKFDAWAQERARVLFDFERPLHDSVLVKLENEKYAWYFNQHHIICDAFSFLIGIRYLSVLYEHALKGTLGDIPPFPSFQDYVAHEMAHRGEAGDPRERAFWKDKLEALPGPAVFYGELAARQVGRIHHRREDLGEARTARIRELALQDEVAMKTPFAAVFNLFASVLATYLYRMSGNRRVAIGMPFHNRKADAYKETVGIFIGVLPLYVVVEEDDTLQTLLGKVGAEASGSLRNSAWYFHNLLHTQSHDVLLNYLLWTIPDFCGATCGLRWIHPEYGTDPLVINFYDNPSTGNLGITFDFKGELFDEELRELTVIQLLRVMDAMLENPSLPVGQVHLLSPEERQRLEVELNQTAAPFPSDKTVHQLFEAQADRTPSAVALSSEVEQLTYAELNRRANRIAHFLRGKGVGPDVLVGLCMRRSPDMVAGLLGILKAGGAYVPLDPAYPRERLEFMIRDSMAPVLVTESELADLIPDTGAQVVCLDRDWPEIEGQPEANLQNGVAPANLAYVIYTSGSTGRPKGAMLEHRGLCNLVEAQTRCFGVSRESRVLQFASLSFDASVSEIFMALRTGATLCLAPRGIMASADDLHVLLRESRITTVTLPPSVLKILDPSQLPELRTVIAAGESCPAEVVERWARGRRFFNAYGPTETTVCASVAECTEAGADAPPIGKPIANTRMYILDDAMRTAAPGVPGELYIGGVGLARGYWNRQELTAERFVADPFSGQPEARLYRTGDRARFRANGDIEFLGRVDHQVKIRGYRIELGEIETQLLRHPDLSEAVVVARVDSADDPQLVAYVVSRNPEKTHSSQLKAFLRQSLPEYMVPAAFVALEALPLNPNGKVNRQALPQPDRAAREVPGTLQAPRDSLELELTHIWEQVLDVRPISVTDNFFNLGGHSLSAVHLMEQVQKHFGVRLAPATLFEAPTIERFAGVLRPSETASPESVVVPIRPQGDKAPFFCVHPAPGTVFCYVPIAQHMDPERPFYGLQAPAINGEGRLFETVEETAAHYVEAMRAVRPHGPYHLGGHSSGGVIAFEMARQLQKAGHEVGTVVLLDTLAPLPGPRNKRLYDVMLECSDDSIWLASILIMVEHFFSTRLNVRFRDLRMLAPEEQYAAALNELKRVNFLAPSAGPGAMRGLVDNCRSSMKAGMRYCPEPYTGDVAYLYTSDLFIVVPEASFLYSMRHFWNMLRNDGLTLLKGVPQLLRDMAITMARSGILRRVIGDRTLGWRAYVTRPVDTRRVPGNHISMLADPHAEGVAKAIEVCLALADERSIELCGESRQAEPHFPVGEAGG